MRLSKYEKQSCELDKSYDRHFANIKFKGMEQNAQQLSIVDSEGNFHLKFLMVDH